MIKNKRKPEQFKLITDKTFPFAAKEAYNSLRTNLLYALSPTNGKALCGHKKKPCAPAKRHFFRPATKGWASPEP